MAEQQAPDFTIVNNPHAFVHCGPVGPSTLDDKRDFTIVTSANNHCVWHKNGSKIEHIQGPCHEVSGHSLDPTQHGEIGRSIIAQNGDLVLNAERGTIYLKAKNIHIETTGEEKQGNFLVNSNGFIILASTQEVRLAGSRLCLTGTAGVNVVSSNFIHLYGKVNEFSPVSSLSTIKELLSGNWSKLVEGLSKTCGKAEIIE